MTVLVFFFADLSAPGAVFLAVGATATVSIPALLLADAHREDFDPRPAARCCIASVRTALEAGPLTPAWEAAITAGHDLNWVLRHVRAALRPSREACRDAAALLILLTTSPKGAMA